MQTLTEEDAKSYIGDERGKNLFGREIKNRADYTYRSGILHLKIGKFYLTKPND
jgi:hypothetical protein